MSPILDEIKNTLGVTALIYARTPNGFIVVDKKIHPENVAMREVGELKPDFILSPWGFLYLATLDEKKAFNIYQTSDKPNNANITTPSFNELHELVQFAKTNHYADDGGKVLTGIRRIAAPIYRSPNEMVAALAIGSISSLLSENNVELISETLIQHSNKISHLMQGN